MKRIVYLLILVLFAGCATVDNSRFSKPDNSRTRYNCAPKKQVNLPFAGDHKHKLVKRMSPAQVRRAAR